MRAVGKLLFHTARSSRKRTIEHLTMAFGKEKSQDEIYNLAKLVFQHFSITLADMLRMPQLIDQGLENLITGELSEHVKHTLSDGKGVIFLTGHFGNWELLGSWVAHKGMPLKVVGSPLMSENIDKLLVKVRNQAGYTNIARGKATREIIRTLKKGGALGMLIDQDTRVPGVFAHFFGKSCHTPVGAVQLAQKLGVEIVPIFMYLKEDLTYHVECGEPIPLDNTGNEEDDLFNNTQKCNDVYEKIIRRFPEQWAWMHRRWRKRPEMYGEDTIGSKKVFGEND